MVVLVKEYFANMLFVLLLALAICVILVYKTNSLFKNFILAFIMMICLFLGTFLLARRKTIQSKNTNNYWERESPLFKILLSDTKNLCSDVNIKSESVI